MKVPSGKLLLAAAVLCGAALAQAADPSPDQAAGRTAPNRIAADRVAADSIAADRPAPGQAAPGPAAAAGRTAAAHRPLELPATSPAGHRATGRHAPATDRRTRNVIYLTFDDGPQPVYTPKVLAVLARHQAKATFFVLGREAAAHPRTLAATRAAGHRVGNHTWDHPMLTTLSDARLRREIGTGVRSRCFRPPFRDTDARVVAVAARYHQRQALWDVDTKDWSKPGVDRIEQALLRGARPGAIFLMHDGGGNRSQTVAALDRALPKLAARGYSFRPLPC